MKSSQRAVSSRVQKNALIYGNKTANLMELKRICEKTQSSDISVKIPEIFPLSNENIQNHLDKHADKWRELWLEFTNSQQEEKALTEKSREILKNLRKIIKDCFKEHPLSQDTLKNSGLPSDTLLMVRSTGEEDTDDMANPGGNKSIAAVKLDSNAISNAIGKVIASYFGEKSLTQRLLSKDNITKLPLMPVLIQKMIGEKLEGETNPSKIITSGVMYASNKNARIQAAPGHGEIVVGNMGASDTFDVTSQNNVHAEIHKKSKRLVSTENGKSEKRQLIWKENPKSLQSNPSLPSSVARNIAKIGKQIAKHYKKPMDIEFVYHPEDNMVYIVQARPIPQKKQKVEPSTITPSEWIKIKEDTDIPKAEVEFITKGGNALKVIQHKNEIIFASHTDIALRKYLNNPEFYSKLKAVIVKNNSLNTSHEAAQFHALGIALIYTEKDIEPWMNVESPRILIDPQHQHVLDWSKLTSLPISKGLYASSSSAKKTPLPIDKIDDPEIEKIIKKYLPTISIQNKKITYRELQLGLDELNAVTADDNNEKAFASLQTIADFFAKLGTSKDATMRSRYKKLFTHALLSIAEIHYYLEKYSGRKSTDSEVASLQKNILYQVSRLRALIENPGEPGLYSDSVKQIATDQYALDTISFDETKVTPIAKNYLVEFNKLSQFALNDKIKDRWKKFVSTASENNRTTQMLAQICLFYRKYQLEFELLNTSFEKLSTIENNDQDILVALYSEMDACAQILTKKNFDKMQETIQSFEKRIDEWSDPNSFPRLYEKWKRDLEVNLKLFDKNQTPSLAIKTQFKQIRYLIDVMDRTIKSLKGSPDYQDKKSLLLTRSNLLLDTFNQLMENLMWEIPVKQYEHWAEKISKDKVYNDKYMMMNAIREAYLDKITSPSLNHLQPSGYFSVSSATVGTTASFQRQFVNKREKLTMDDIFTLTHQNALMSTLILDKTNEINIDIFPEKLQPLLKTLQNNTSIHLVSTSYQLPNIVLEYNVPLDNHSAKFIFEFNKQTNSLTVHGKFFGENWYKRMDGIAKMAKLECEFYQGKIVREPHYHYDSLSLDFAWNFQSQHQMEKITAKINNIIYHYSKMTEVFGWLIQCQHFIMRQIITIDDVHMLDSHAKKVLTQLIRDCYKENSSFLLNLFINIPQAILHILQNDNLTLGNDAFHFILKESTFDNFSYLVKKIKNGHELDLTFKPSVPSDPPDNNDDKSILQIMLEKFTTEQIIYFFTQPSMDLSQGKEIFLAVLNHRPLQIDLLTTLFNPPCYLARTDFLSALMQAKIIDMDLLKGLMKDQVILSKYSLTEWLYPCIEKANPVNLYHFLGLFHENLVLKFKKDNLTLLEKVVSTGNYFDLPIDFTEHPRLLSLALKSNDQIQYIIEPILKAKDPKNIKLLLDALLENPEDAITLLNNHHEILDYPYEDKDGTKFTFCEIFLKNSSDKVTYSKIDPNNMSLDEMLKYVFQGTILERRFKTFKTIDLILDQHIECTDSKEPLTVAEKAFAINLFKKIGIKEDWRITCREPYYGEFLSNHAKISIFLEKHQLTTLLRQYIKTKTLTLSTGASFFNRQPKDEKPEPIPTLAKKL